MEEANKAWCSKYKCLCSQAKNNTCWKFCPECDYCKIPDSVSEEPINVGSSEWTLLKCLKCDFPFLVSATEYIETIRTDSPFMFCPKCGTECNVSKDAFKAHISLPITMEKVTRYIVRDESKNIL